MREFGIIYTRYWTWVRENQLDDISIIIGAYLLSCEHGNSLGCFRCPPEYVSADLSYPIDTVSKGYTILYQKGLILYCERSQIVFFPKYLLWNQIQNKNHGLGTLKIARNLPSSFTLFDKVIESLKKYSGDKMPEKDLLEGIDTLSHRVYHTVSKPYGIPYTNESPNTETEKEKEKDNKTSSAADLDDLPPPTPKKLPSAPLFKKSNHWLKIVPEIKSVRDQIASKNGQSKTFNPDQWIQSKLRKRGHPQAIQLTLSRILKEWDLVPNKWGYAEKIYSIENKNYNERDFQRLQEGNSDVWKEIWEKLFEKKDYHVDENE